MLYKISVNKLIFIAFIFSSIFYVSMLVFFFVNLSNATSNYSMGGVTAPLQLFYNFMHDRPFQTSLFSIQAGDAGLGVLSNPFPYSHINAIHTYWTPFLFAPLWNLWPTLSWLYGLVIVINYLGMAIFTWKILKYLSPQTMAIKTVFAMTLLLSSGFLYTFTQMAQLLLFGGPFILAAYYFLLTRQKAMFLLSMAFLCLISEDAAMAAASFAVYIYLFERDVKNYAIQGGLFAIIFLVIDLLVVQPAARSFLATTDSTTAIVVVNHIFDLDFFSVIGGRITELVPALFFLPAFGIIWLLFGKPNISWIKIGGLILIAPFPHWGESVVVGGVHHLMPVIVFMYIAFVLVLAKAPDIKTNEFSLSRKKTALLFLLYITILVGSLRMFIGILPEQIRLTFYSSAGMMSKVKNMEVSFAERRGNQRVIDVVRSIPKENSLVYLTNESVSGFIGDRSDIWMFPYFYNRVDYLVIQPNAHQSSLSISMTGHNSIIAAIADRKYADLIDAAISQEFTNEIIHYLVDVEKSHRVVVNESQVVLLERIKKQPMDIHPSTIGFGWIHNIFSRGVNPRT